MKCNTTETSIEVSDTLIVKICSHHVMLESTVSDRDCKFTSKFWKFVMELCDPKSMPDFITGYERSIEGFNSVKTNMRTFE